MDNRHTEPDSISSLHTNEGEGDVVRPPLPAKKSPERTCLVTRETYDKADLFRFVIGPNKTLYFDYTQKLPGRGLYVVPQRTALQSALQKNLFAKAAKKPVDIPDDLLRQIEATLHQATLDQLGLARRAGQLIISAEKIEKFLRNGNTIGCYLTVAEPQSDTRKKITRMIGTATRIVASFSQDTLSKSLKLENPVHLGIKSGALCDKFLTTLDTLHKLKETKD